MVMRDISLADQSLLEHDKNTPCDGPLLNTNKPTSFRRRRNFTDVHGDLGRFDTHTETVEDTAHNEHANVLGGAHDRGADDPLPSECQ